MRVAESPRRRWTTSAKRERLPVETIRDEVARGRMIIPANIRHANLEPMCIGVASRCKVNSNIGNSATTSDISAELEKLRYSVHYGADTVMDLSTGGDIPRIREAIIRDSPVPIGTVPIYEALTRVNGRIEDLTWPIMRDVIEEQAEQGVGLHDHSRGRADPVRPHGGEAHHGHRKPWRGHFWRNGWFATTGRTCSTTTSRRSAGSSRNTT